MQATCALHPFCAIIAPVFGNARHQQVNNMTKSLLFCLTGAAALFMAGCATWTFSPIRSVRFVSEEGTYLHVDYGREEHETTFVAPTGVRLPFKTKLKVRVETPDGRRFVAWQVMSTRGVLYKTDDEHWEYYEEGTGCILAEMSEDGDGYEPRFQGVLCATLKEPGRDDRKGRR